MSCSEYIERIGNRTGVRDMKYMLVYQAGLANVFSVDSFDLYDHDQRGAKRLLQGDFRACENFTRGLLAAGAQVRTAHCNMAGDVVDRAWSYDRSHAPFAADFCTPRGATWGVPAPA